ncbi:Sdh7p [Ascoidea rubescens DSM 1968]|uniref:Succinate dehydrogenase assembly factor 3 n=1 Tax=Ascoidea rubescens DSM 1968 TaxID=1344418 RepID=A0A1D2VBJ3_9ASCO|nr:ACN9-domain-containing protein [Ascoidea rubescens DSM 1968]ODV58972.1 ACN9-domain-containing protein [Ascoidea rubescens DSM 1968]
MRASMARYVRPRRPVREGPALLPPVYLYRRILRAHRFLPASQRFLGDMYVKEEFRAHRNISDPLQIVGFLTSWQEYLTMISDGQWKQHSLTRSQLDKMSPEQIVQLYELMKESKRVVDGEGEEE